MTQRSLVQFIQTHPFQLVMAVLAVAILWIWLHIFLFERSITEAMNVAIPEEHPARIVPRAADLATSRSLRSAAPRGDAGKTTGTLAAGTPTPVPTPTPIATPTPTAAQAAMMELPKDFEELLKAKAFFGGAPATSYGLQCIWANSVLVNGQWLKLGQPNGNLVLKEIGLTTAVLEVNGQKQTLAVWPKPPR